ncbi:hypothetical protein FUAX_40700 (plasmid) [Fulvitalea axinellae]|uniref:Uncharacterized protein n=2 Tax=Fulvitalea axinellae TaxID=1182444 RepID=A0AAU9CWJ4_9BACT|nr:hypothetical protein FUAX_32860 [Fulvitalea axinellae]BDD11638.1 hypothetical protein FUAX_40700 [Fulvitalea axinellae]
MVPVAFRKPKRLAWLLSLTAPVVELYTAYCVTENRESKIPDLWSFRDKTLYDLRHNSTVVYMEKLLNDRFNLGAGPTDPLIRIADGSSPLRVFSYLNVENNPIYTDGPTYTHLKEEYAADYADFIIQVPSTVNYDVAVMKSLVNKFKLAGKKYKIVTV